MIGNQNKDKLDFKNRRFVIFYLVFFGIMFFYIYKLFIIQIIDGKYYLELADENRISVVKEQTTRGIIYDRNGVVLARNVPTYDIVITPAELPEDEGDIQNIYRQLSELIDIPVNNGEINDDTVKLYSECATDFGITQIVYIANSLTPYKQTGIKCDVEENVAMEIEELSANMPGVEVRVNSIREYPTGYDTSEVVGFLGPIPDLISTEMEERGFILDEDKYGYGGVESSLQDILSGKNGRRVIEVDVAGLETRDLEPPKEAVPGYNIKLTLDVRLQKVARAALIDTMNFYNNVSLSGPITYDGAAIAMNPKTGEILAMVSEPTYDNNRMTRYIPAYYYQQLFIDQSKPLMNHSIQIAQPPGSVFKIVTGIGAINERVVAPDFYVFDPGSIYVTQSYSPNDPGSQQEFVCHLRTGHGQVDYIHALAWSCNIYFNKVGGGYQNEVPEGLGIDRLGQYAHALGYGEYSNIELDGEEDGLIPTKTWKRVNQGESWATGDTYLASMGQGYITASPLQVLGSFVTVANKGIHMKPTIIREVLDQRGNVVLPFTPKMLWDITKDPKIMVYDEDGVETGEYKAVEPWVIDLTRQGLRLVTQPGGTGEEAFAGDTHQTSAKTGTAEYCDDIATQKGICIYGSWPAHAWTVAYAPYDEPEIAVVVFVYNGKEGAYMAGYPVRRIVDNYFLLKEYDAEVAGEY
ncbi:MAG: penicillin-binding protein 2 [Flexilinea sp.]